MSNIANNELEVKCQEKPCSAIERVIKPRDKDLGEFMVRRSIPTTEQKQVGPWVFFDHMGPAVFQPGQGVNVRPHPHINLATVTYLFAGEILHRDSLGSEQAIRPGDINLMVAGKGIVHSERERREVTDSVHQLHGLQLWLALPEKDEEIDPAFYHYPSADIPELEVDGVTVKVMMGSAFGKTSPVKTFAKTIYLEASMDHEQTLALPDADERGLYVVEGEVEIDGIAIEEHSMAILNGNPELKVTATKSSRIALIGGEHLGKRYIEWNFVSSRKERIEQAKQDWKDGKYPKVPGDELEFIPLPE